jgi:hypothetical protein
LPYCLTPAHSFLPQDPALAVCPYRHFPESPYPLIRFSV